MAAVELTPQQVAAAPEPAGTPARAPRPNLGAISPSASSSSSPPPFQSSRSLDSRRLAAASSWHGRLLGNRRCCPVGSRNWRHTVHRVMTETATVSGTAVTALVMTAILLSIVTFCIESYPSYREMRLRGEQLSEFDVIETVCIAIFTAEFFLRLFTVTEMPAAEIEREEAVLSPTSADGDSPGRSFRRTGSSQRVLADGAWFGPDWKKNLKNFATGTMNWIDLLSILPFYVELGLDSSGSGGGLAAIRVLRLARILRILKLGRSASGLKMVGRAMVRSLDVLAFLLFFAVLGIVLFGSLIFITEAGEYDEATGLWLRNNVAHTALEPTPFTSIPASFWWVIVTATTVGYGDFFPTSTGGKFIGAAVVLCGIIVLALPITVIGTNFSDEYAKHKEEKEAKQRALEEEEAHHEQELEPEEMAKLGIAPVEEFETTAPFPTAGEPSEPAATAAAAAAATAAASSESVGRDGVHASASGVEVTALQRQLDEQRGQLAAIAASVRQLEALLRELVDRSAGAKTAADEAGR